MERPVVVLDATVSVLAANGLFPPDDTVVVIQHPGDPGSWWAVPGWRLSTMLLGHIGRETARAATVTLGEVLAGWPAAATVSSRDARLPDAGALLVSPGGGPVAWLEYLPEASPTGPGSASASGSAAWDDREEGGAAGGVASGGATTVDGGGAADGSDQGGAAVIDLTEDVVPAVDGEPRRRVRRGGLFGTSGDEPTAVPVDPPVPLDAGPTRSATPGSGTTRSATPAAASRGGEVPPAPAAAGATPAAAGGTAPARPRDTVTAHARVEAPDVAPPATEVDVIVGLAAERQPGVTGSGMELTRPTTPGEPIRLTVQLAAAGCELPQGNLRRILVDPDDIGRATTSLVVLTPDVDEPTDVMLQIDYSVDEQLVGKAWRAMRVQPATAPVSDAPVTAPGQTAVDVRPRSPVDLTIKVLRGDSDDELLWLATTPLEGVDVPEHQISSRLAAGDARAFALDQVTKAEKAVPALVAPTLTGMSRTIARAVPREIWEVLGRVWRAVVDGGGDRPSVLVATSEAWVPWELASVEEDFVADQALLEPDAPPILGCQVRLGRWVQPGFGSASGMDHTALPPPSELGLSTMAVVHGRYGESFDFAELPEAQAECDHLEATYPSVRFDAELEPMLALLSEQLELPPDTTGPVDVIHIACHGKIDKLDPLRNGIVLDDDVARLGEQVVAGGSLREGQPLVFVNACQLATSSTDLLGNQGGLAAAFLSIGARGYIAPLWSVEDVVARRIAEDLHEACLREHVPVGEAIRRARCRFVEDPTSATPLAYVYYGHPDLVMAAD